MRATPETGIAPFCLNLLSKAVIRPAKIHWGQEINFSDGGMAMSDCREHMGHCYDHFWEMLSTTLTQCLSPKSLPQPIRSGLPSNFSWSPSSHLQYCYSWRGPPHHFSNTSNLNPPHGPMLTVLSAWNALPGVHRPSPISFRSLLKCHHLRETFLDHAM